MPTETELDNLIIRLSGDTSELKSAYQDALATTSKFSTEMLSKAGVKLIPEITNRNDTEVQKKKIFATMEEIESKGKATGGFWERMWGSFLEPPVRESPRAVASINQITGATENLEQATTKGYMRGRSMYRMGFIALELPRIKSMEQGISELGRMAMYVGMQFGGAGMAAGVGLGMATEIIMRLTERSRQLAKELEEGVGVAFKEVASGSKTAEASVGRQFMSGATKDAQERLKALGSAVSEAQQLEREAQSFRKGFTYKSESTGESLFIQSESMAVKREEQARKTRSVAMRNFTRDTVTDFAQRTNMMRAQLEALEIQEVRNAAAMLQLQGATNQARDAQLSENNSLNVTRAGFDSASEQGKIYSRALEISRLRNVELQSVLREMGTDFTRAGAADLDKDLNKVTQSARQAEDALERHNLGLQDGTAISQVYARAQEDVRRARITGIGPQSIDEALARRAQEVTQANYADRDKSQDALNNKIRQMTDEITKSGVEMSLGADAAERWAFEQELIKKNASPEQISEMHRRISGVQVDKRVVTTGLEAAKAARSNEQALLRLQLGYREGSQMARVFAQAQDMVAQHGGTLQQRLEQLSGAMQDAVRADRSKAIADSLRGAKERADSLRDEAERAGMAADAAERYAMVQKLANELEQTGLSRTDALRQAYENLEGQLLRMQAAQDKLAVVEAEKQTVALERQAAAIGKTSIEAKRLEMIYSTMERTGKSFEMAEAMIEDQIERTTAAMRAQEAAKLFEETRTPVEKFGKKLLELDEMLDSGAISWDTYNRAVNQAEKQILGAHNAMTKFDAAAAGSAEAMSRISAQIESFQSTSPAQRTQAREEYQKATEGTEIKKAADGFGAAVRRLLSGLDRVFGPGQGGNPDFDTGADDEGNSGIGGG